MSTHSIPFNRPSISGEDIESLIMAVNGGHSSGNGPFGKACEKYIEEKIVGSHALLTTSCTHALELAARLCDLQYGDEVIVPAYTFVSTASAFALTGARPVFVDSKSDTLNIDPDLIREAITPRTKAVCIVHYGGIACDMDAICSLVAEHGLTLIEDNAHGLFATYKTKFLGSFGALATQSFHETKNLTCGEGGALLINDRKLIERAEILREKGTNRNIFLRGLIDKYTWVEVGSSWVISDLLSAILYSQLKKSTSINSYRVGLWDNYDRELADWAADHRVQTPIVPHGAAHVGHLYHLRFRTGDQRSRFIKHMASFGISCVFHYQSLNKSPVGRRYGGLPGQCPVAEHATDCLVRLPLYNSLTLSEQSRVVNSVRSFLP